MSNTCRKRWCLTSISISNCKDSVTISVIFKFLDRKRVNLFLKKKNQSCAFTWDNQVIAAKGIFIHHYYQTALTLFKTFQNCFKFQLSGSIIGGKWTHWGYSVFAELWGQKKGRGGTRGQIYVLPSAPSPVLSSVLFSPLSVSPASLLSARSVAAGFSEGPVFTQENRHRVTFSRK